MLGKHLYGEWLIPIVDYYRTVKKNEVQYEIGIPCLVAVLSTYLYYENASLHPALMKLRDLMPNALAILIGFSITCITILLTSNNANIETIKQRKTARFIDGEPITVYQWVFIMFVYILIIQIFLLLFILFVAFVLRLYNERWFMFVYSLLLKFH
ncbi:MAG TPA: hypothetical protein DCP36_00175 [Sporomusaceae bacterium]|nr:hypothetical protein [Sporomusaceae bacterium]